MPYSRRTDNPEPGRAAHTLATGLTLLILFVAGLAVVEVADASWGPNSCSQTDHCYATVEQWITGTAAYARVTTQGNYEPCWEAGCFTTNELWIRPSGVGEAAAWIEVGEIGGYGEGIKTRRRFYAEQYPGSPFYVRVDTEEIPLNATEIYGIRQCADGSGYWCVTWNGAEVHRFGGWHRTYEQREYGVEIASEVMPGTWGQAEGIEGDGSSWGLTENYIEPGMGAERCSGTAEGAACLHWGMGSGPHERLGEAPPPGIAEAIGLPAFGRVRRLHPFNHQPHPRRQAGEIYGRAHRALALPGGGHELWVGRRRPTAAEVREQW